MCRLRHGLTWFFLLMLSAGVTQGQPFIFHGGIVNAASYLPPGLPNGTVARGSVFSLFGRSLGPATPAQVTVFPLQEVLAGVAIDIVQGATTVHALPVFVAAGQINAILPSNTPLGWVSARVRFNGQTSNPVPLLVAESTVGLFAVNGGGFGPGIVQNFVSPTELPINSLTKTATPGQAVVLWGTGLGAVPYSDGVAPTAESLPVPVEIFVGGKKAGNVLYSGRTPCCAAIDQYVFTVPNDAPTGCYVPVVVRTRGSTVSNTVTMAIDPAGAACSDAHYPLSQQLRNGGKAAFAQLTRDTVHVDVKVTQPYDVVLDGVLATFRNNSPNDFFFSALTAPPPLGTCTVYGGSADRIHSLTSPFAPPGARVNAGSPLKVEAGSNSITVPSAEGLEGTYSAFLGGQNPMQPIVPPPLLSTGPFTLSAPGSPAVSAFSSTLDSVDPVTWTNRDQITTLDRTKDLTLTWASAPPASRGVAILGSSERVSSNAISGFFCLAPSSATTFTVPSYVLAALPASDANDYSFSARIAVGNVPLSSSLNLPGFHATLFGVSAWTSKTAVTK